jgi:phospholipid/cholesterol/gamma-HCH transport system substrate-binding protein
MNKKISPTLIGAFVVGALALVVLSVVAFGSGRLFRQTKEFVLFFPGEVNGLHVAAPVKFRGVEIGAVKQILLKLEPHMQVQRIPVIIEIDLKKVTERGASGAALNNPAASKALIDEGLRGQLRTESLVTGVLYVGLDFFPGTTAEYVQPAGGNYDEIPTVPTALEQAQDTAGKILAKLQQIDFQGMMDSAKGALDGVNHLVNSPEVKASLRGLEQTMPKLQDALTGVRQLTTNMDANVAALSTSLQQTSDATREAMIGASTALKETTETMKEADAALTNIRAMSDPDSTTFYEITRSLREVSAAARSLRLLSSYIERNPRALIFGKPEPQEGQ